MCYEVSTDSIPLYKQSADITPSGSSCSSPIHHTLTPTELVTTIQVLYNHVCKHSFEITQSFFLFFKYFFLFFFSSFFLIFFSVFFSFFLSFFLLFFFSFFFFLSFFFVFFFLFRFFPLTNDHTYIHYLPSLMLLQTLNIACWKQKDAKTQKESFKE